MRFDTAVELTGPLRVPAQMLESQEIHGSAGLHDEGVAEAMGLAGAPIEAPTHFSQFDPLAFLVFGESWFERGCISGHFKTMVRDGELVQATLATQGHNAARIQARKADGAIVLSGSASVGPVHPPSELDLRLSAQETPAELFILDQVHVGMTRDLGAHVAVSAEEPNGPLYPFSLAEKLERITEPHPWYTNAGGATSPWGRAILPMEMISVLAHKVPPAWPIRTPAVGLFLDLEVRLLAGPVFVGQEYEVRTEIVGLSASRRTESYWSRTTVSDTSTHEPVASVLLHSGLFKDSYPGYPVDRLA
jgi:hypothetical protein